MSNLTRHLFLVSTSFFSAEVASNFEENLKAGILLALIRYMKLELRAEYCYMSTGKMFKTYFYKKPYVSFLWGATETGSWGKKPLWLESQAMPVSLPPDKWEVIQEAQPDQASAFQLQILFHECVAPVRYNGVFWFTPTQRAWSSTCEKM